MTYQARTAAARANPTRSIPTFRPAAQVFGAAWYAAGHAVPVRAAPVVSMAEVEQELRFSRQLFVEACAEIGEVNRLRARKTALRNILTPERIKAFASAAFRAMDHARGRLRAAEKAMAAA
jgi:hypothetical protein